MSVDANFTADFSDFLQAVDAADVKLADFAKGAQNAERNLNRMVDTFSGRAMIQEATNLVVAIDKIGGVSQLTAKELASVSSKAAEASEKLRALGYDVPKGIEDLASAVQKSAGATKEWSAALSTMQGVLGAFGIQATIGGVIDFGKSVLEAGDKIQKMSDQTGLTTEEVQKFQYVAGQTGSSMESMVTATQILQEKLGKGDQGLANALAELGIEFEKFKAASPYEQMTELAEGIQQIKDPTDRARVAGELFGRQWRELLPALISDMRALGDEAPKMADSTVKSLDRIGDALTRAKAQATAWAGGMADAIEKTGFQMGQWLSRLDPRNLGLTNDQLLELQYNLNDPTGVLRAMSQKGAFTVPPEAPASVKALTMSMEDADAAAKGMTNSARELIKAEEEQAKKAAEAAKATADASLKLEQDYQKASMAGYEAIQKKNAEYNDAIMKATMDRTEYEIAKVYERADAEIEGFKGTQQQLEAFTAAVLRNAMQQEEAIRAAADANIKTVRDAYAEMADIVSGMTDQMITDTQAQLDGVLGAVTSVGNKIAELQTVGINRGATVGGLSGISAGGMMGGSGSPFNSDPRVIGLLSMGYTPGEAAAIAGGYGGMISIPFGQRQAGLASMGGLGGVNININGSVLGNKDEIARAVGDSLTDALRRQGYTLPGR